MNNRGDLTGIFYLIITIATLSFVLLIGGYVADTISTEMKEQINTTNTEINNAFSISSTVATETLPVVWFVIFAGMLLILLVTSYFMSTNPIFVPIFIILLVIAILIGYALSETYVKLYDVPEFSSISATQASIYFIMSNLPYVAMIIGFLGLIITFAKPGGQSAPMM